MYHPILESYLPMVKFLGQSLGNAYEVFLTDFTDPAQPIIAIENGYLSGRSVGSLMRDETLKLFEKQQDEEQPDFLIRHDAVGPNGRRYISSSYLIRDEERKPLGALILNFNMEPIVQIQDLLTSLAPESQRLQAVDVGSIIFAGEVHPDRVVSLQSLYTHVMNQVDQTESDKTKLRQAIINSLYKEGAFDLKGAVPFYATQLKISEPSVYRYLQRAKEKLGKNIRRI